MRRKLDIPPPRLQLFPLRDRASAAVTHQQLDRHRSRVTIDHEPLEGVTPAELVDWFSHIGETVTYGGQTLNRYAVWHPFDHIHWALARPDQHGGAGEDARFRIVEAFGADPRFYVDTTDTVEKLDESGIRLVRRVLGVPVLRLEHSWSRCPRGAHYVTVLDIGARARLFRGVNRLLSHRVFPAPLIDAWIRHNIEEVGLLVHIIPLVREERDLHAQSDLLSSV